MISKAEQDLFEQMVENGDEASVESLGNTKDVGSFWELMPLPSREELEMPEPVTRQHGDMPFPSPETPANQKEKPPVISKDHVVDWLTFAEMSYYAPEQIIKELGMLPPGSTVYVYITKTPPSSFRWFLQMKFAAQFLKNFTSRIEVYCSMFVSPGALPIMDLADEIIYGEYSVVDLTGTFPKMSDIPDKFKECVGEMNELNRESILQHRILTSEQIDNLVSAPQAGGDVLMVRDIPE